MSIDESSVAFIAFFVEGLKPNDAIIGTECAHTFVGETYT